MNGAAGHCNEVGGRMNRERVQEEEGRESERLKLEKHSRNTFLQRTDNRQAQVCPIEPFPMKLEPPIEAC